MTILQQKHKTLPQGAYHEKSSHPRIILTLVTATTLITVRTRVTATTLAIAKILVKIKTIVRFTTLSVTTLVRATVLVIQCSTYSCIGVKTAALRSCNRSVSVFGLNHIWNVYQVLQARNPNKSQKMHDPESPHFVIGSTRNTNSTMLLYWLAQLVGDKTFGILKELRRSFCCCCFFVTFAYIDICKTFGEVKTLFS